MILGQLILFMLKVHLQSLFQRNFYRIVYQGCAAIQGIAIPGLSLNTYLL